MSDRITEEVIDYIGILSKLELSESEKEKAREDMENMLKYIDKLKELDTEGIEPMSHIFSVQNVFRDDIVENGNQKEEILLNAPAKKDGCFQVPKTVK